MLVFTKLSSGLGSFAVNKQIKARPPPTKGHPKVLMDQNIKHQEAHRLALGSGLFIASTVVKHLLGGNQRSLQDQL